MRFLLRVFYWIIFPRALTNNSRVISNFLENSWKYSQVKVHHWWQICCWCQRHQLQIMGKILDCWHLKVNLKEKSYLYVDSTTQRCKKIVKMFLIEDFFCLPPASTNTGGVHLELWISPRIFEKIWNGPNGVLRSMGETDSWKKLEVKSLVALSL